MSNDLNLMTPERAAKKICPQTIARDSGGIGMCVPEACMAWRWDSALTVHNPTRTPGAANQQVKQTLGYCGLAGKP